MNTFTDYEREAARTMVLASGERSALLAAVYGLGLTGEAGEVADLLKKHLGHGHEMGRLELAKELGDVLWYVTALAQLHGLTLSEVARLNADKLRKRYPDGFSHEASRSRPKEEAP